MIDMVSSLKKRNMLVEKAIEIESTSKKYDRLKDMYDLCEKKLFNSETHSKKIRLMKQQNKVCCRLYILQQKPLKNYLNNY